MKKSKPFMRYMKRKLALIFVLVALALFALALVLLKISTENNEDYTKIIFSQQDYDSRTLAFRRGDIVDRNGTVLATSTKVYNLILDPVVMVGDPDKKTDAAIFQNTLDALVEAYGYDRTELEQLILEKREINSRYVIYKRELTEEQMNAFLDVKTAYSKLEEKKTVAGVWFETKYKRIYPYGELACWLLGFSRDDSSVGSYGVEQYYNDELVGTNGREYGYLNDDSNLERVVIPAVDGNDVVLTIDASIQKIVQDHIAEAQVGLQAEHIGVVVMDPHNGEILAMAGDAVFDCNDPSNEEYLLQRYTQEKIDAMTDEERVTALAGIWKNFCISETYEPGSTTKTLTIAAALDEGAIKTNNWFVCDGGEHVGSWTIKCNNGHAHGNQDLTAVLGNSCNDALMQIGAMLNGTRMSRAQILFGFGAKTGVDLPGEESGILQGTDVLERDASSVATNAFGQNINVTMIQQIAAYCSVVNGGTYYEPHIVRQIKNSDGALLQQNDGVAVRETVSRETAAFLKDALLAVVDTYTGKNAQIDGYEIWGKTGTAEKIGRDKTNYLLSFIGGVNPDDPEIVLYVVVDAPHGVEKQAQSSHASTLWREIMTDLLKYLNIYPTRELKNPVPEPDPAGTGQENDPAADPEGGAPEGDVPEEDPVPPLQIDTEDDFSGGIFGEPGEPLAGEAGDPEAGDPEAGDPGAGEPAADDPAAGGQ